MPPQQPAGLKESILVVEDDVDLAEMLAAYFHQHGYQVHQALNGEEAIHSCLAYHPDLVILDIRLPDMDGFAVANKLRSHPRNAEIPIIFLTEKRDRADRLQGLALGADDYITKPFDINELRLRVRNTLQRAVPSSLTNPVTGLAEGALVDEALRECLAGTDWALLLVRIAHLAEFGESYGFVSADDVLRAVSLVLHNAARDLGSPNDFIGHLDQDAFILITKSQHVEDLAERIHNRISPSLDYFYPTKDRAAHQPDEGHLGLRLSIMTSYNTPPQASASPQALKDEIKRRSEA